MPIAGEDDDDDGRGSAFPSKQEVETPAPAGYEPARVAGLSRKQPDKLRQGTVHL